MTEHSFIADNFEKASDQDILAWNEAKLALAKAKAREAILRAKIVKTFFATPKEGTNYHELGKGYKLKLVHKIDRKIDAPLYTNLLPQFKEHEIDTAIAVIKQHVAKLRDLSPLWDMYKDGIDLSTIQWAAH